MDGDDFKELQKLGSSIQRQRERQKEKTKLRQKISLKIRDLKKYFKNILRKENLVYLSKKIRKRITFAKIRLSKKFENISFLSSKISKRINLFKKNLKEKKYRKKKYVKGYKLVEKRKKRRNKVVIIRKRVPVKINKRHIGPSKQLKDLMDITFNPKVYYFHKEKQKKAYEKLKESIWDF
ncbi:MAG: hypothetical protein V5A68_00380 [Candidatus Thermoplasmatota archaeon]